MSNLFDGERAFKDLEKLAVEIGPRPGGSEAEGKAVEYIKSEFENIGLKTIIQEFEVTTGEVISKKLEVVEPYHEEIICEPTTRMGNTGSKGVTGDLVYVETTDEEYLTPDISGKIVITSRFIMKNMKIISKLKPLGFIIIENYPGVLPKHLWGSAKHAEKYGSFPAVRISHEDGLKLFKTGAERAHLLVETKLSKVNSRNVIGELEGDQRPEEIVVVGGHYDTVLDVRGASDNAAGTTMVMELARVFKEKGSKRTLRFIAWGAEEMGLVGSHHYARRLRKEAEEKKKDREEEMETELDRIKLVVNLDVHGALLGTNSAATLGPPELMTSIKLLSKEVGMVFDVRESVSSSDGTSLASVGVPSVSFSRRAGINIMMHSIEDVVRYLNPESLQRQGRFVEQFLTRYVSKAAAFPFEREIPEKMKKEIEKYYKRTLRSPP